MDTQTLLVVLAMPATVLIFGGWMFLKARREQRRIEEEQAVAEAKRQAKIRDEEAQRRYDRTRRAAGLPTASDFTPRRSAPLPAYRAPSPAPAPAYSSSPSPAPAYDPYLSHYGAASSPWHSSPSPAPCPSYESGSSYSSSCDSSSSSSDGGSSCSSSCD